MTSNTIFDQRRATWYGLGKDIQQVTSSKQALELAGLDWKVIQKEMITKDNIPIEGYKANIRSTDDKLLGIVSDRYQVIQNQEAFAFTDELIGEGVSFETAGSFKDGKKTWILAKLPVRYIMRGDAISPYLVFYNTHDGSGSIKMALTPIRVACQNTLNLALQKATRTWSSKHTTNIQARMDDAKEALFMAENYMDKLGEEVENLSKLKLGNDMVEQMIQTLIPVPSDATSIQEKNTEKMRMDFKERYFNAPDLQHVGKNAYRFINAASDYATHALPLRETESYQENLFAKTIDGNPFIDKAYQLVKQVA